MIISAQSSQCASTSSHIRHSVSHYRKEWYIHVQGKIGKVYNSIGNVSCVYGGFLCNGAISLQYTFLHLLCHRGISVAYIDLPTANIVVSSVKRCCLCKTRY